MTSDDLEVLEGRIRDELDNISRLETELAAKGFLERVPRRKDLPFDESDTFTLRAIGSILHDFYCAVENIFKMVARHIDGSVPTDSEWHIALLRQMSIELPTHRPHVIRKETAVLLDEFRSFRHVFRNVYGFVLAPDRLKSLLDKFPAAVEAFNGDIQDLLAVMKKVVS